MKMRKDDFAYYAQIYPSQSVFDRNATKWKTYLESTIPRTSTEGHTILTNSQTTHPILMTGQNSHSFPLERIPNVTIEIVVTSE